MLLFVLLLWLLPLLVIPVVDPDCNFIEFDAWEFLLPTVIWFELLFLLPVFVLLAIDDELLLGVI